MVIIMAKKYKINFMQGNFDKFVTGEIIKETDEWIIIKDKFDKEVRLSNKSITSIIEL